MNPDVSSISGILDEMLQAFGADATTISEASLVATTFDTPSVENTFSFHINLSEYTFTKTAAAIGPQINTAGGSFSSNRHECNDSLGPHIDLDLARL